MQRALLNNTSVIILAAGSSGRMGIPKALLKMPSGGTFLDHAVMTYLEAGIQRVAVVLNPTVQKVLEYRKPMYYNDVDIVINNQQEKGRLFSIKLGLDVLPAGGYYFIQNVDQPFITLDLIGNMMKKAEPEAYVVPCYDNKGGHPVLIDSEIASVIVKKYNQCDQLRIILDPFFRNGLSVLDPKVCENINTPDDYLRVFGVPAQ
jgi:CTP:molybdopterin cytidylyltransferase MocA